MGAVVFDLDGTLIDTEGHYRDSAQRIVQEAGGRWTEDEDLEAVGMGLQDLAALLQHLGVSLGSGEIVDRIVEEVTSRLSAAVPWRPGALAFVAELQKEGLPIGVATMAHRPTVEQVLAAPEAPRFAAVVTGDDVSREKPAPDVYLRAAELLAVSPGAVVGVEDSLRGLAAVRAAGMCSVGVPAYEVLEACHADILWGSLEGKNLLDLKAHT
ncbi:HAD family phosphatase [Nesterenkonia sp. NBAIMH1]|uniref:HAD family hydrolase n=1 Tax=Nesterenkonia sp. NBAIMH1 TaxID=2600320 RepID=UPI00143DB1B6|nr:HAD family phosphatase [Nesterenkonia sp. NBAIMH1]